MEQQFKCSGDCLQCHPNQRQYCAAQFTYNTYRMLETMQGKMEELEKKIDVMQHNEAVFSPIDTAQEEDGASQ